MSPGRIEFVILRTGRSPPAALHHASLRRSCIRLQAGERLPGEDFHLSERARFQARVRRGYASPLQSLRLVGLRPWFGLWPINTRGKARTGGAAHSQSKVEQRGGASPHIRRRSRNNECKAHFLCKASSSCFASKVEIRTWIGTVQRAIATWSVISMQYSY